MTRSMLCLLGLVCVTALGHGQPTPIDRSGEVRPQSFLLYEPLVLPGKDSTASMVDIPYRIDAAFFIAVRTPLSPPGTPFLKRGEIAFELIDSTGASVGRDIQEIQQSVATSENDPDHHTWIQGRAGMIVPPGRYRVYVEVTDIQSRRTFNEKYRAVAVPWSLSRAPLPATLLLCQGAAPSVIPDTLRLVNAGTDYLFGKDAFLALLAPALGDTAQFQLDYELATLEAPGSDPRVIDTKTRVPLLVRSGVRLAPVASEDSTPTYRVMDGGPWDMAIFSPPFSRYPLRNYTLKVTARRRGTPQEISQKIRALWPDMPASLRDVDGAILALRFLLPEDSLSAMRRGDYDTRRDRLEAFWARLDRTPGTAYNEMMAEYYHRVDVATRSFGTLKQPDGARSDRGRIYVLHGPPTTTERRLTPRGVYEEVWRYDKTGRTFLFQDPGRTGTYTLVPSTGS